MFLCVTSKPDTVEYARIREGISSARTIKSGTAPNRYRPAPLPMKLLVTTRKFLTSSALITSVPAPPALVKYVFVSGLNVFTVLSTPPTSKWNREDGSTANFAMISGCTLGMVRSLLTELSTSPLKGVAREAGRVGTPPPPDPPKYWVEFSSATPNATFSLGWPMNRIPGIRPQNRPLV